MFRERSDESRLQKRREREKKREMVKAERTAKAVARAERDQLRDVQRTKAHLDRSRYSEGGPL
jgi:hypothetical protein